MGEIQIVTVRFPNSDNEYDYVNQSEELDIRAGDYVCVGRSCSVRVVQEKWVDYLNKYNDYKTVIYNYTKHEVEEVEVKPKKVVHEMDEMILVKGQVVQAKDIQVIIDGILIVYDENECGWVRIHVGTQDKIEEECYTHLDNAMTVTKGF